MELWSEELRRTLERDLVVSDVGVVDDLIAEGYLSPDDWNSIHLRSAHKKKVRRLVALLKKHPTPKAAFTCLCRNLEISHQHLVKPVRELLQRFPDQVCGRNVREVVARNGIEHEDTSAGTAVLPQGPRVPVEHIDASPYKPSHTVDGDRCGVNEFVSSSTLSVKQNSRECFLNSNAFLGTGQTGFEENNNIGSADTKNCIYDTDRCTQENRKNKDNANDIIEFPLVMGHCDELDGYPLVREAFQNISFNNHPESPFKNNSYEPNESIYLPNHGMCSNRRQATEFHAQDDPWTVVGGDSETSSKDHRHDTWYRDPSLSANHNCARNTDRFPAFGMANGNLQPTDDFDDIDGVFEEEVKAQTIGYCRSAHSLVHHQLECPDDEEELKSRGSSPSVGSYVLSHKVCSQIEVREIQNSHQGAFHRSQSIPQQPLYSSDCDSSTDNSSLSEMNDEETKLCSFLEKNLGSVSDILDDLIEDGVLSSDDWRVIHATPVQRKKALHLVKIIRGDSLQRLNIMKSLKKAFHSQGRSDVAQWLDQNMPQCIEAREPVENTESDSDSSCSVTRIEASSSGCHETSVDVDLDIASQSQSSTTCKPESQNDSCLISINSERQRRISENQESRVSNVPCRMPSPRPRTVENIQEVFDRLNIRLNNGMLKIDALPDIPNVQCIVFYLQACNSLYAENYDDAEKFISLSEMTVDRTSHPVLLRSEVFTARTWWCLRTNKLGLMESLLRENEQYLMANPNAWSYKALGWFYFDYGRCQRAILDKLPFTKATCTAGTCNSEQKSRESNKREKQWQQSVRRFAQAVDCFRKDVSSDGPIGQGFALCELASLYLNCGGAFHTNLLPVSSLHVLEAEKILATILDIFDTMPPVLKASFLLPQCDLLFRKDDLEGAYRVSQEAVTLATDLELGNELKGAVCRREALDRMLDRRAILHDLRPRPADADSTVASEVESSDAGCEGD